MLISILTNRARADTGCCGTDEKLAPEVDVVECSHTQRFRSNGYVTTAQIGSQLSCPCEQKT